MELSPQQVQARWPRLVRAYASLCLCDLALSREVIASYLYCRDKGIYSDWTRATGDSIHKAAFANK